MINGHFDATLVSVESIIQLKYEATKRQRLVVLARDIHSCVHVRRNFYC